MKHLIGTLAATAALAFPAFAQDAAMDPATMTCSDFMALDAAGQQSAMTALQEAGMAAAGDAAATGAATTETAPADAATDAAAADATATEDPMMQAMMTACEGDSGMLAMDAYTQAQGG